MKNTPASAIHQLVPQNMLRMNLVTSLDSLTLLTGKGICSSNPLPANCRTATPPADKPKQPAEVVEAAGSSDGPKSHLVVCTSKDDGAQLVTSNPKPGEVCHDIDYVAPLVRPLPTWPAKDWTQPTGPYSKP